MWPNFRLSEVGPRSKCSAMDSIDLKSNEIKNFVQLLLIVQTTLLSLYIFFRKILYNPLTTFKEFAVNSKKRRIVLLLPIKLVVLLAMMGPILSFGVLVHLLQCASIWWKLLHCKRDKDTAELRQYEEGVVNSVVLIGFPINRGKTD